MRVDFVVNGEAVAVDGHPLERLLDVVRERLGATGTKEGCGEGECGACTVLLDGRPVLSCLVPLAQCAGRAVETVEAIAAGPARALVERLVAAGGVQCGACTPGIVVIAWALLRDHPEASREQVREALAGNLCRCTGYEGIVRALAVEGGADPAGAANGGAGGATRIIVTGDAVAVPAAATGAPIATGGRGPGTASPRNGAPRTLDEALRRLAAEPGLRPVAGGTDLMVCEPEDRADMPGALDLFALPELAGIRELTEGEHAGGLEIGAAVTFTEIRRSPLVRARYPALAAAAAVVGGWQIQNRATIGGNAANASPAGDSLPVLLALDAEAVAAGAEGTRTIPYREFHTGYRRTALRPGELLAAFRLPPPPPGSRQAFRKVGTRAAQAISKVVAAALARVGEDGRFDLFRLAAGSVAPTPVRLAAVEEAVSGRPADEETAALAGRLAAGSVTPIDDVRSTADYRRFALERVVRRMVLDLAGTASS
jgi:carbon-monoxide dehydrogenase small subunit/xanthine dehydrogenase small subunit